MRRKPTCLDTSQSDLDDVQWNKMNDGHSYAIFFVDFGNTEHAMSSSDMRSFTYVASTKAAKTVISRDELDFVLTLPFQAVCCQLKQKKPSTRNSETLKTLMIDQLHFQAKMIGKHKKEVIKGVTIDKYTCNLSLEDGQNVDNQFEDAEPTPTEQPAPAPTTQPEPSPKKQLDSIKQDVEQTKKNKDVVSPQPVAKVSTISVPGDLALKVGKSYECKCVYFSQENDIFINLKSNTDELLELERELANFEQPKVLKKNYEM